MTGGAAVVGLGEVGRVFVEDLRAQGIRIVGAWDTAFANSTSRASLAARELGLSTATSAAESLELADLVVSAVTAGNCVEAAREAASFLRPDAWFLDVNSASPAHKRAAAEEISAGGGRYVEVALMAPIEPRRLAAPFALGGPHAESFLMIAKDWGILHASLASEAIGRAAATKLCRSVIVKGLEAIFTESLLAARRYGVVSDVLDSLSNILPQGDWESLASYFISRSAVHGIRRAEEMEEAAATVADVGIEPLMAQATALRQRKTARMSDGAESLPSRASELLDFLLERSAPYNTFAEW